MVALLAAGEGLLDRRLAREGDGAAAAVGDADRDGDVVQGLVECVQARAGPALSGVDASLELPAAARRDVLDALRRCLDGPGV